MSLPGGNTAPYRLPCAGTPVCFRGPRYQNAKAIEKNIPVYLYNATVPDWQTADNFIAPYERLDSANNDCTPCSDGIDSCPDPDPTQEYPPCGLAWIGNSECQYLLTADAANPPPVLWYQPQMLTGITIADGGSGYLAGDSLAIDGGTVSAYVGSNSGGATVTVSAVNGLGAITAATISNSGSYQSNPASPNSPTGGHGTGVSLNLTLNNQFTNLSTCHKYGYKNVQAMRYWHGQPGYFFGGSYGVYQCTNPDYEEDGGEGYANACSYGLYTLFSNIAPQTKYTTVTGQKTIYYSINDEDNVLLCSNTVSSEISSSVDPTSGVITNSIGSLVDQCYSAEHKDCPYSGYGVSITNVSYDDIFQDISNLIQTLILASHSFDIDTCDESSWQAHNADAEGNPVVEESSWITGAGSFNGTWFGYDNDGNTIGQVTITVSDDSFYYYTYNAGSEGEAGGDWATSVTIQGTLSGSNTADDIQEDITTLLDYWDFTDDALYPWRTDNYTSMAPLMSRNEVPSPVAPGLSTPVNGSPIDDCDGNAPGTPDWTPTYDQVAATDPNAATYDGSILGAPMPAGYQGYFDFGFVDYGEGGLCTWGFGWDAWQANSSWGIPLNATQWTNLGLGVQFPPGAWIFYNLNPSWLNCSGVPDGYTFSPETICVAQKWAETKMGFASYDFFRPAGDDRFAYDQTQVYSISNQVGSGTGAVLTLENTCDCSSAVGASCGSGGLTSAAGLWGGSSVGGFYEITAVSNVVTLGTKIYDVPSNWTGLNQSGDSANCFGKLRWSTGAGDPPAILGRAAISDIAEYESMADVTELTTDELPTLGLLISGNDLVDIYDSGMTLISGNLAVTRIDDTHFTVPVAVGTLIGATWIQSHGAPAYYWNDQYSKGDYVYTDWTWWPRQICEANRINNVNTSCTGTEGCFDCPDTVTPYEYPFNEFNQEAGCVPFNPCNPSVLCISPNDESFPNGTTYGFTTIDFDEQYGSGWQAEFQQVMVDLLWQEPHYPAQGSGCTSNPFNWEEDNGTCQTGDNPKYFPMRPLVEARLTVPSGAPALPAGITLGWDSPVDISGSADGPFYDPEIPPSGGSILFPPASNGAGGQTQTLWGLWSAECDCISDAGDFADEYENVAVGCP